MKVIKRMCRLGGLLFLIGYLLPFCLAQGPAIRFEHLRNEEGELQDNVSCILQDSKGYMWFSTNGGLKKFDGYTFTTYLHDPQDSTTLSENLPNIIWEDKEANLWVGTSTGGLSRFDRTSERFVHFKPSGPKKSSQQVGRVTALNEDSENTIWVGHWGGKLTRFDKKTGTFYPQDYAPLLATPADTNLGIAQYISFLYNDKAGNLWIGNNKVGVHRLNKVPVVGDKPAALNFTHFRRNPPGATNFSSYLIRGIYQDQAGMVWLCTANGLNRLDPSTGKVISYFHDPNNPNSISSNDVSKAVEDHQGNLWIVTLNGLNKLNKERTRFTAFSHDPANANSPSSNDIQSLYLDRSGILWIGTANGIDRIHPNQKPFFLYRHNPFDTNSLSSNAVKSIWEEKSGVVWVGTLEGGLNAFDKKTGKITRYRHHPDNPKSLRSDMVTSILEDREGNLWVATAKRLRGTLSLLNRQTGEFTHYGGDAGLNPEVGNYSIRYMYEDRRGIFWLCTSNGISSLDPKTGVATHYPPDATDPDAISEEWANTIREDSKGNLWVGTDGNALEKLDRKTGKFIHYKPDKNSPDSISSGIVRDIFEDSGGLLWIGTLGGGLCRFDYHKKAFTSFTQKQGLPGHSVYSIQEDIDGNLWLGTNNGLSRLNTRTLTFTNFDVKDGLQGNHFAVGEMESGASFSGKDGKLYFGGNNGMSSFFPHHIQTNQQAPPVVITLFKLFDKVLPGKNEMEEITLSYHEDFFSFEFAALNYTNTQKNQYAYQLVGFDKDWVYSGSRRYASYTNLDPGEYTFRVKGSNNDGIWNEQGASIRLVILPPWWRTWWAYALYAFFALGITAGSYAYLLSKERLKHDLELKRLEAEKLKEMDEVKSRFFANISHEFRTPLTLILGPVQHMLRYRVGEEQVGKNHQLIYSNAHRLLELINQLLDISKLEAGSMALEAQRGDIAKRVSIIVFSFASLAESKGISLSFEAVPERILAYFDQEKLGKIISNLLSNALNFTLEGGSIKVKVAAVYQPARKDGKAPGKIGKGDPVTGFVHIIIADTGIGIAKDRVNKIFDRFYQVDASATREQKGSGIGLALVKELVALHRGEIEVQSEEERGTVFTVRLPLAEDETTGGQPPENQEEEGCLISLTPAFAGAVYEKPTETPAEQAPGSGLEDAPGAGAKERVQLPLLLIVEDNIDVATYIKDTFAKAYLILVAPNGQEGLALAIDRIPDLVISDLMMPKMDGITLCSKLKADERTSHIPIILLTAKANVESKLEGLQTGADDYVTKPFYAEELMVRVRNLIEGRKKLRERYSRELTLQPCAIAISSADERFLGKVMAIMEGNVANADFDVETFGKEIGMSRMQLHRKLTALLDQSPGEFIRNFRLQRAITLLDQNYGNISDVAFSVGFNSLTYFTKCFREHYGQTPSDYLTQHATHSPS